jgi:hypothetical protein
MANVQITDSDQTPLAVPLNLSLQSAIVKYAQTSTLTFVLPKDKTALLGNPLKKAAATPVSLGINIEGAFNFGTGEPQFSIGAGASAAIHVNAKKDSDLFSDDLYQSQIKLKDGEGYLSLALTGSVTGKESQTKSNITLGFDAGASATFEFFRRFAVDDTNPKLGDALGDVISNFVMPADVTDLASLNAGDIATSSGKRHLKVSGKVAASASAVPLATPALPLANQAIDLNAGAKVNVSASFEITSAWQIRARVTSPGIVELGFYKQHGSDWDINITASAGIDASLGKTDLLTELIGKLSKSKDPKADQKQLEGAGLKPDEIKAINAAIKSSIDHSIHGSLSLDLNGLSSDEAAFLYNIKLAELTSDCAAAVTAALDGDLTELDILNPDAEENGAVGPGITLVRSILTRTKKTGTTFKMNFIGLLNFISLSEFLSKSQVIDEPTIGVVFKETASGQRIESIATPQGQAKLRKVIFDSVLMTTTYRCAGALEAIDMECSGAHFAKNHNTNEHTMSDYLDWFIALGLLTPHAKVTIMSGFHGTGESTCTARVNFSDAACKALFLDDKGASRLEEQYVGLGRNALAQLLMPGDQNDEDLYRRNVLTNDNIWNQFQGQTTIGPVMERVSGWRSGDYRIGILEQDYTVILWWAAAMHSTAVKIVDMQDFLKTTDPNTLKSNKVFLHKRDDVQKHVLNLLKKSPMSFDQPFGLVALAKAAGSAAFSTGVLLSPAIKREFGAAVAHHP